MGFRAIQFRRYITAISDRIDVKIIPSAVSTLVGTNVDLEAVISNSHSMQAKIIGFRLKVPAQIENDSKDIEQHLLPSGSNIHIELSLKSKSPGQFKITKAVVTLKGRSGLFQHDLSLNCDAEVEIAPLTGKLATRLQLGSIAEASRIGIGTDLTMLREATVVTDFHSIDWKSTARTGKFIVKEFYPETDPAVMLLVDKSVLTIGGELGASRLVQLGGLIITFGSSASVGAIIYDETKVIAHVPPASGVQVRQQMLRSLLAVTTSPEALRSQGLTMLYEDLTRKIRLMKLISNNQPLGRVDIYARSILPYYESIAAKQPVRLMKSGAFRALEIITNLPPSLVIIISPFGRDLTGLCEGALLANASGHRIIIGIIGDLRVPLPLELSTLIESGIQVLHAGGADLVNAICQTVMDIPKVRIKNRLPVAPLAQ